MPVKSCFRTLPWLAVLLVIAVNAAGGALPREVPPVQHLARLQTPAPTGRVVVKFAAEAGLFAGDGVLGAVSPEARAVADRLERIVARLAPGSRWQRRFTLANERLAALRETAASRGRTTLPDLRTYAQLTVAGLSPDTAVQLVVKLAADPAVETAFLEPVAVPAALGFDAFSRVAPAAGANARVAPNPRPDSPPQRRMSDTPDFITMQGYLNAAPQGVGALEVRDEPGARGAGVKVIDVEGAWLWAHEDLPDPFADLNEHVDIYSWRQHGTAVLGVIRGIDNGYGVVGIAPDCEVGASSIANTNTADAILAAVDALDPGDVILIELHAPGPNANGVGQFGYVPMEFWQDVFDALQLATALGITVVEAAGNGEQNLDDPVYLGLFDRLQRDSGAIMVGASQGAELEPAWFTNHGTRVDLHGWGFYVVTGGYGYLQGEPLPEERYYTDAFNGTSSASPIVVGAVVGLQGMIRETYGFSADARLIRDILRASGTPQEGEELIGPRPHLPAARDLANTGIGELVGTVRDASSGDALPDVLVRVGEDGAFDITGADGAFRLALLAGTYDLSFASFYHQTATAQIAVGDGQTTELDLTLTPWPQVDIGGLVTGGGAPLAGVVVTPLNVPIAPVTSGSNGEFLVPAVPAGRIYSLLLDRAVGFGAALSDVPTVAGELPEPVLVELAAISEDFEEDPVYAATDGHWTHGTPPSDVPGTAFSGAFCWGVGMDGAMYPDDVSDVLTSAPYDLSDFHSTTLFISFHYYSATEAGFDGVNLRAVIDTANEILVPLEGYSDLTLGGLAQEPGWSGDSGGWRGTVFDISHLLGEQVTFQWTFGSDGSVNGSGFFMDGVTFTSGDILTAAPRESDAPPAALSALATFPNPFNPSVTVAWRVADAGHLRLEVYDPQGHRLRTLLDGWVESGAGQWIWDGRDSAGRRLASGVYLVRLSAPDGSTTVRRVVLAK